MLIILPAADVMSAAVGSIASNASTCSRSTVDAARWKYSNADATGSVMSLRDLSVSNSRIASANWVSPQSKIRHSMSNNAATQHLKMEYNQNINYWLVHGLHFPRHTPSRTRGPRPFLCNITCSPHTGRTTGG